MELLDKCYPSWCSSYSFYLFFLFMRAILKDHSKAMLLYSKLFQKIYTATSIPQTRRMTNTLIKILLFIMVALIVVIWFNKRLFFYAMNLVNDSKECVYLLATIIKRKILKRVENFNLCWVNATYINCLHVYWLHDVLSSIWEIIGSELLNEFISKVLSQVGWLVEFCGISTSVGYLMTNLFLSKLFYLKKFCLVKVHILYIKNISISRSSVYSNSSNSANSV